MLSDEITTGSVRSTDAEKRQFASKSHEWNCKNHKFKTIFADYATPEMKRLPNMGEFDMGKPDGPPLPRDLGGEGKHDVGKVEAESSSSSVKVATAIQENVGSGS